MQMGVCTGGLRLKRGISSPARIFFVATSDPRILTSIGASFFAVTTASIVRPLARSTPQKAAELSLANCPIHADWSLSNER